ncbi:uncharacterized protein DS421_13g388580 [Arachis hypogaea]|nr:uncharacterized protein DS421_13g388580 [Arachis hypogaea]
MEKITEGKWGAHVLNFIIKGITEYHLKKKKSIDGCLFALMIIYFHLAKNKDKKGEENPGLLWVSNWNREQLVDIVKKVETKKKLKQMKEKEKKEKKNKASSSSESDISETEVDSSSEFESEEDSEEPKRKQPNRTAKKIESRKRKQILEDSNSETESNDKAQSKKRKHVVEDSSPQQTQSYDGSKLGTEVLQEFLRESKKKKINKKAAAHGMPEVNLGSENDPLFQGQTDQSSINKPANSMLSLVEELANDPAQQNMMVVQMETHSQPEALSIVPIQVYVPLSQTIPVPAIEQSPTKSPREKISEERTKSTPQLPKPDESTPTVPPAPSKINPAPEDTAALMMMAQTASYIPKEGLIPSFSLGLTDSSQEEALTQEGQGQPRAQKAKSSETSKLIEQLEELMEKIVNSGVKTTLDYAEGKNPLIEKQCAKEIFEKFEIPVKSKEMLAEMKEKCYVWATRVKTYGDGSTNEYDPIVTAMCLILNQQNIKRFQEEIYCLSPDIVNMAIGNHSDGEFLQPKSKKPFRVEDYPMFILFLDLKKLASHRYSIGGYGWLA